VETGNGKKLFRIPVDHDNLEKSNRELTGTGLRFTLGQWGHLLKLAQLKAHAGMDPNPAEFPTVRFELSDGARSGTYLVCARLPQYSGLKEGKAPARVSIWYHYPDARWGDGQKMGALQFLVAPDGKMFYRLYTREGLRQGGQEIDPNDRTASHKLPLKMDMSFQVSAYLEHAIDKPGVVPVHYPLGLEPPNAIRPAIHFTLSAGSQTKEAWVRLESDPVVVDLGDRKYLVRYRPATLEADFQLTLKRAREIKDEGSDRPAWYESEVVLTMEKDGKRESVEDRVYMNHTISYGAYKLYQTNYQVLTYSDREKIVDPRRNLSALAATGVAGRLLIKPRPVSLSGLAVKYDPGLIFPGLYYMYAGSCLVVLGIATMFYMKAYFFKPRGGRAPAADDPVLTRVT
jgi:hypothetical protein